MYAYKQIKVNCSDCKKTHYLELESNKKIPHVIMGLTCDECFERQLTKMKKIKLTLRRKGEQK